MQKPILPNENLRKATDYSQGQKDAAYSVLVEIVNLLEPFADDIRIIGGWAPTLLKYIKCLFLVLYHPII